MTTDRKNTVRLGLFVLLGISLFTAGVYYIGNQQNLFGAKYRLSALFNNVGGLQVGNNVRYAGINVGNVVDIVFVNDSTLRVDMRLDDKVRHIIKKDATASIGSDGLVGNTIVNISPGIGNRSPAHDGDILASYSRVGTEDIMKTLGNTNENIAILSLNLLEITDKLNRGQGTLPRLIRDSTMARDVTIALQNLRQTTEYILLASQELNRTMAQLTEGQGLVPYLLEDTTIASSLESTVDHIDGIVTGQVEPMFEELRRTGEELSATTAELKAAVDLIRNGEGLAGTLLQDTATVNDLRSILNNVDEGTARFNENMEAMRHNFLFRRYFKKQEKEKEKAAKEEAAKEKAPD